MTKYKPTDEGVAALGECQKALKDSVSQVNDASSTLLSALQGNESGAGPHADEIMEVANEVKEAAAKAEEPIDDVCESLSDLIEAYEAIIAKKIKK